MSDQTPQHQTFTLDGTRFTVGRLPPRRALRMAIRLGKIIGPGAGAALKGVDVTGVKEAKSLGDLDVGKLVAAIDFASVIGELADRLSVKDFEEIQQEFMWNATADLGSAQVLIFHGDTDDNFNRVFEGRPLLSLQVLAKAMAFTYGNFSKLLGSLGSQSVTGVVTELKSA